MTASRALCSALPRRPARRLALALLAGVLAAAGSAAAWAQAGWPTRAVSLMVPWPAGGPSDFVARHLQPDVQKALGQPMVIENLGGVGGAMGVQKALNATDGHTLILGSPIDLIIPPLTIASVKYKPTDMRMVAQLIKAPLVLLARKDLPAGNIDELLALAARSGKPLALANTGPGTMFHLVGEKFAQQAGMQLLHVPYRGSSQALTDLMGGQVDLMFTIFAGAVPATIADGKVKAIGLATAQALPRFPHIGPLAAHARLKDFEFDSWAGIMAPRQMPDAVVARLNQAFYDALKNPQTRAAFEAAGNQVMSPMAPAELDRVFQAETARYQAIARSINLQPQQQ